MTDIEKTQPGHIEASHLETQPDNRRPSTLSIGRRSKRPSVIDPNYVDHRANDDRVEEAKGRNSDGIPASYWYSWRFLGSMFAVGLAFMGGIGGK